MRNKIPAFFLVMTLSALSCYAFAQNEFLDDYTLLSTIFSQGRGIKVRFKSAEYSLIKKGHSYNLKNPCVNPWGTSGTFNLENLVSNDTNLEEFTFIGKSVNKASLSLYADESKPALVDFTIDGASKSILYLSDLKRECPHLNFSVVKDLDKSKIKAVNDSILAKERQELEENSQDSSSNQSE